MQALDVDTQSLGGGGGLGFGGGGNNPLLWLVTLAFLRGGNGLGFGGDNAGAGVIAGENGAKLDCLSLGQQNLSRQAEISSQTSQFQSINDQLVNLAGISRDQAAANAVAQRDLQDTFFRESAAQQRQLAECCCDIKEGQQAIQTAIAMQTNIITQNDNNNTQKIIDKINDNVVTTLTTELNNCRSSLSQAELLAAIKGTYPPYPGTGGMPAAA